MRGQNSHPQPPLDDCYLRHQGLDPAGAHINSVGLSGCIAAACISFSGRDAGNTDSQAVAASAPSCGVIHDASEFQVGHVIAPTGIPPKIRIFTEREEPVGSTLLTMDQGPIPQGGGENPFGNRKLVIVARNENKGPMRVSSGVMSGLLIRKTIPSYPPIAKAMGIQGTVVLQATISKSGTIENLRVISGPAVLQQAAVDAVKSWRYSPYLLSQDPVEVETSINVIFTIAR